MYHRYASAAATMRLLLWSTLLLQNYIVTCNAQETNGGVARHLLLSESTTEQVRERLLRLWQRSPSRPCGTETSLSLPPSVSLLSSCPSTFATKLIHAQQKQQSEKSFTDVFRLGVVGNAVDRKSLRFWKTAFRLHPKNVYSLIAALYFVVTIQRRFGTLVSRVTQECSALGVPTSEIWYVGGTLVIMLSLLGTFYLGRYDSSSSTLLRYGFSSVGVALLSSLFAQYYSRFHAASTSTIESRPAALSTHELDTTVTPLLGSTLTREEGETSFDVAIMSPMDGEAVVTVDEETVSPWKANATEGISVEPQLYSGVASVLMDDEEENCTRSTILNHWTKQFRMVHDFLSGVTQRFMAAIVSDSVPSASRETGRIDPASVVEVGTEVMACTDHVIEWERYAFRGVAPTQPPLMLLLSRFQPSTIRQGFVALVAGTLFLASYALGGLPVVAALPLLPDAAAAVVTWSAGGLVYDYVQSLCSNPPVHVEDSVPQWHQSTTLTPWNHDQLEMTLQSKGRCQLLECSNVAPPLDMDHWKTLLRLSRSPTETNEDPRSATDDQSSGRTLMSNPPFQTVEMDAMSPPDSNDDSLENVSVVQMQFYLKPVQHLLRAILVAGGGGVSSSHGKNGRV